MLKFLLTNPYYLLLSVFIQLVGCKVEITVLFSCNRVKT
nr:MAG TPA: hypothetical protein [Caudoviricetes sp.]